ncbi:hypothetical protein Tco_0876979 [Tanacetum coccineum]|uniref:Uncharacterized protein n=1 Tax=Tanacetum coccineum TaxID=301880 RepID=A0ABQ5BX94_9ASTR
MLDDLTKNLEVKVEKLAQTVLTNKGNTGEKVKAKTKKGKEVKKQPVPRDLTIVNPYVPPTPFLRHLKKQKDDPHKTHETVCMIKFPKKTHKEEAQVEDYDEGDVDDSWDITIKDVESLRQILTPTIHTLPNLELVVQLYMPLSPFHYEAKVVMEEEQDYDINSIPLQDSDVMDGMMQPLTPHTVHITQPDDDYVAPATSPILDKHLNKFREELFDITGVDEKANGNPITDIKELLGVIMTDVEFETFIQQLNPLKRGNQPPKSSNETSKKRREMKSHMRVLKDGRDHLSSWLSEI